MFALHFNSANKSSGSQEMTLLVLEGARVVIIISCFPSFYAALFLPAAHVSVTGAAIGIFKLWCVARDPTQPSFFYDATAGLELCSGTRAPSPTWVTPSSALTVLVVRIYGSLGCKQS